MSIKQIFAKILTFGAYSENWRCNFCEKENFNGKFFCDDCETKLPYNNGSICDHCGRALKNASNYCSTCKERLLSIDKARSVFIYDKPISTIIKNAKYDNAKYVFGYLAEKLSAVCISQFGNTEIITCIPMTKKRYKTRGFNQSKILAENVANICGIKFVDCLTKTQETERQAKLGKEQRLKNLKGTFRVSDKSTIRGKNVLIVDDVSTTGATGEAVAETLKKAGALRVYLLTVASVPPKNGY